MGKQSGGHTPRDMARRRPICGGMRVAILIVSLLFPLAGCYLSPTADRPDELARSWSGATVAVPFSTVDPDVRDVSGRMGEVEASLMTATQRGRVGGGPAPGHLPCTAATACIAATGTISISSRGSAMR